MVEAATELLGGTTVAIFLALCSSVLSSRGTWYWLCKSTAVNYPDLPRSGLLDRLEDSIDDDLTDIVHSLDGMTNGLGGRTQLHQSGGTMSSGPGATYVQQTRSQVGNRGIDTTGCLEPGPTAEGNWAAASGVTERC